jgi:hypothetical protein
VFTELFKVTSLPSNVKICLSSQPLVIFQDAFLDAPALQLQDFTIEDINRSVNAKLNSNPRFQQLAKATEAEAASLIKEIVGETYCVSCGWNW